jgi:protein-S-isoprenylcysteine O-methyltransferase Ste14
LIYDAIVAAAFHLFIVLHEEPNLVRRFGSPYEHYRAHVPRWLPQLPPWHEEGKP